MKKILSVLLVVALLFSFTVSAFAAGEQPSGSSYASPSSYSSTVMTVKDFWTALTNSAAGIYYKLGSTSQSGSVLYILNNLYSKLGSTTSSGTVIGLLNDIKNNTASGGGGGSVSSAWTSTQASNVSSNTTLMKSTLDNIYTKLSSIESHSSAWTSSDVTSVKTYLQNISSMSNELDNIAGYTQTSSLKLTNISSWESYLQSIGADSAIIKANTSHLDERLIDIVNNTSDTAGNTFNIMERLHYLDSAAWDEGGVGFSPDSWWYNMYLRLFGTYIETVGIHEDTTAILPHTDSIDTHTQNIDTTTTNLYTLLTTRPSGSNVYFPSYQNGNIAHRYSDAAYSPHYFSFSGGKWGISLGNDKSNIMDFLLAMNANIVQLGFSQFSANRAYSTSITDYSTGVTTNHTVGSLADFFQDFGFSLVDGVSRLSYMIADDDDIALKHSQADNIQAVHTDFLSGQDSPTSIGVGAIGTVKGIGDTLQSIFSVGSVNPASFLGILSASDAWAFFSNQTKTDIGMNGSQRRMLKSSAFSDLDTSGSSVEVINYYQQNIDEIHEYLEVMSDG